MLLCSLLMIPGTIFCKQKVAGKPLKKERIEYIIKRMNYMNKSRDIYSKELLYVMDNTYKKDWAEAHGDAGNAEGFYYWYLYMDDYSIDDPARDYKLNYKVTEIAGEEACVQLVKTYNSGAIVNGSNERVFQIILKFEDGEWRLHEFFCISNDTGERSQGEKEGGISYLAALPFSNEFSEETDIIEYCVYVNGKECELEEAIEWMSSIYDTKDYWRDDLYAPKWYFDYWKRNRTRKEPIVSEIVYTHKETGERNVVTFTCRYPDAPYVP